MAKGNSKNKINSVSKSMLSIIGIMIIILMFAVTWYWETYGRVNFLYKMVIVLREDVKKGTVITENMITTEKLEQSTLMNNPIHDKGILVGKVAKHFVPGHTPLSSLYFDDANVVPPKDTFIAKIPNDWLLSIPDSIRRKDKAVICEVKGASIGQITAIKPVQPNSGANLNTYTKVELDQIKDQLGTALVTTTVAYVKDGSNKEVVDIGRDDRLDGSSKIASIEVLLNEKQLSDLQNSAANGNKFIILYSDGE